MTEKKKKKVIHTRVSEPLERALKARAEELGVSVSNLVRNTMMKTFDLVEGVVSDSVKVADSAIGYQPKEGQPSRDEFSEQREKVQVLGWQSLVLNLNAICETCNEIMPRGGRGAVGVMSGHGKPPIICIACLGEISGAKAEGRQVEDDVNRADNL